MMVGNTSRTVKDEKVEYVLRMYCLDVGAIQMSSRGDRRGFDELTIGAAVRSVISSTVCDDGELLVARRMHEATLAIYRDLRNKREANRKGLLGAASPEFLPARWLSSRRLALDNLKGSAAMVYFAGGYSKQVISQLSNLNELHGKYYSRGLDVAVVVPREDEAVYAALSEKLGWKFLLAVDADQGRTAAGFFVTDWPSYFLIGRDGKIAAGKYREPVSSQHVPRAPPLPDAKEIEMLLSNGD